MRNERNPNQKAFQINRTPSVVCKPDEEPVPEIDTAKAVAFAMSIAEEMKRSQREKSEDAQERVECVGEDAPRIAPASQLASLGGCDATKGGYPEKDLVMFRSELIARRDELTSHAQQLKRSVGMGEEGEDVEPDGGDGTCQSMRLDSLTQLERFNKTISDIEDALRHVEDGSYGICISCHGLIARERLHHSPFVKTCTACQQKLEQEGK